MWQLTSDLPPSDVRLRRTRARHSCPSPPPAASVSAPSSHRRMRILAKKQGMSVRSLREYSHCVRTLARDRAAAGIRFLLSAQRGPGALVRLRHKRPDLFQRVVTGEMSLAAVGKPRANELSPFDQIQRLLEKHAGSLTASQKLQLRELLA